MLFVVISSQLVHLVGHQIFNRSWQRIVSWHLPTISIATLGFALAASDVAHEPP
ncbi:post-GPI attachment to protein factor 6 isoform X1 [Sesbania bispinosa]|nr:post-GPI attachment to protein factor 6 isoform X1 [Sesbania bispinosa]